MPNVYNTLSIDYNRCPPECRLCEEACAKARGDDKIDLARIKPVRVPQVEYSGALTCIQCGQPYCLEICPVGAIEKSSADGLVRITEAKCIGCGLCTVACPYGGVYYSQDKLKSVKCDQCDGEPKCVEACPYEVLSYVRNQALLSRLQEDVMVPGTSACRGCPAELALRLTLRLLGPNTVIFGAAGCAVGFMIGFDTQAQLRIPMVTCLLDNTAATVTGVSRYYRRIGKEANLVAFVGDGATVDIGFQALSGAAERGENFIYICYDNEGYMNTGVQRSGSTPLKAKTYTTPVGKARHGKEQAGKNLPLLMLFHEIPYVATATIAHLEDYANKILKATKVKDGLAYIHLYSPCTTGWGADEDDGLEISRLAVETNYFPLWEAEHGELRLTQEIRNPKPIQEYTSLLSKYAHLAPEDIIEIQKSVDKRYNLIKKLAINDITT